MKTHWIGIIKWNDGTILRTEPFYKYDEGIKVWASKFSFENKGKFEWINYERVKEPKKETLEQAANKYVEDFDLSFYDTVEEIPVKEIAKKDFIEGAKWQAERMYSEKEVIAMLLIKHDGLSPEYVLQQFKKK